MIEERGNARKLCLGEEEEEEEEESRNSGAAVGLGC
jgi:hypothetical protein